jgi:hypothetical protein
VRGRALLRLLHDMKNILGALILAGAIALPFVIYFWNMTP